jgi:hypothetical protein
MLKSIINEIRSDIEAVESDKTLYEEANLSTRVAALDFLEFDVIERVEGLLIKNDWQEELLGLRYQAEMVKMQLESIDETFLRRLRDSTACQDYTSAELRELIVSYTRDGPSEEGEGDEDYDSLDVLVNGLLLMDVAPKETRERGPEMVFCQPTPARVVLELVEKARLQPRDVFYDIGSGLGQVAILVHLLSEVRAKGVEFEPAYCDHARRCAKELNLSQVEFVNADARKADYSDGTAFFLYTPFEGGMLEQVLERLRGESSRGIRLYSYGPCTLQVARHSWLERVDQNGGMVHRLAIFKTPTLLAGGA